MKKGSFPERKKVFMKEKERTEFQMSKKRGLLGKGKYLPWKPSFERKGS